MTRTFLLLEAALLLPVKGWKVRKDISALGERIARIEGLLEGYTARSGERG